MSRRRESAVVCGASMAGLLAARVLADFYDNVMVVERDVLPQSAIQRRGVSQGRHLHALQARGSTALAEMFPGLFDALAADGADVVDGTDPSVSLVQVGAHQLCRSGMFADPDALSGHLASRPLNSAAAAHLAPRQSHGRRIQRSRAHRGVPPRDRPHRPR